MRTISLPHPGRILPLAAALAAAAALLALPQAASAGAAQGVRSCLELLVPTLFPFMVLSGYLSCSGAARLLGRPLDRVTRALFRLPGSAAPVFLLSLVGGYPVGARGAASLRRAGQISDSQMQRMLLFCVNPGLAFTVSTVGAEAFGSAPLGWLLFAAQAVSSLLLGVAVSWPARRETEVPPAPDAPDPPGQALSQAVAGASRGMFQLCAFVVLFFVLASLLEASGVLEAAARALHALGVPSPAADALVPFLLEVVNGCRVGAQAGAGLPLFAFGIAWGGLCVHLQVWVAAGGLPVPRAAFWLARLLHGTLSAALCSLFLRFFPAARPAFLGSTAPVQAQNAASLPASAALLLLCAVFLFTCGKSRNSESPVL